ncbi:MAG: hypothetical protein RL757_2478 [Bacteroidota bacterium]
MQNGKLYHLISRFDKIRRNQFRRYLMSPYFNVNQSIVALFDLIEQDIVAQISYSKPILWAKIFPEKPIFDDLADARFRKLSSDLTKLLEDFLIQQHFEAQKMLRDHLFLDLVNDEKIEELNTNAFHYGLRTLEKSDPREAHFLEQNYHLLFQLEELRNVGKNKLKISEGHERYNSLESALNDSFVCEYLKLACRRVVEQKEAPPSIGLFKGVLEWVESQSFENKKGGKLIEAFFNVLMMFQEDDEKFYYKTRTLLRAHHDEMPRNDRDTLYSYVSSFCVRRINKGNQNFTPEVHDLNKEMLSINAKENNKTMSHFRFTNIVMAAVRSNEFKWGETFIKDHAAHLPEKLSDNVTAYNLALVYFHQKKYDQAEEILRTIDFEDVIYSLGSKNMLMCIYYEQDEYDLLDALISSFTKYLRQNKMVTDVQRQQCLNQIKFLGKMLRIQVRDKTQISKLEEAIRAESLLANKGWLLQKISELR